MYAHRIDIFDEAYGDELVVGIAHNFELEFFPAEHAFLDQDLADEAGINPPFANGAQLFNIVDDAAAGATHRVGGANDDGVAEIGRDLFSVFNAVDGGAFRHFDAKFIHCLLELDAVFTAGDGIELDPDHLYTVFFKNPVFSEILRKVESRLSAEVRE